MALANDTPAIAVLEMPLAGKAQFMPCFCSAVLSAA